MVVRKNTDGLANYDTSDTASLDGFRGRPVGRWMSRGYWETRVYSELTPDEANTLIEKEEACIIDIRDSGSYSAGHISNAIQLDNASVEPFLENTDKEMALIIYCYHGISSNSAASFFVDQGFSRVHHIVGGFEAWQRDELPIQTTWVSVAA